MQLITSESGHAGAIACRPYTYTALLLHPVSARLSLLALPQRSSARFTSILSSAYLPRPCLNVVSIHALDPDFYKIPYVEGIPVGKRLKLWNLPPNCKHSELLEWFAGVDVVVESLELTDDPALNAQGIGGFVEFSTKQHACIAIVRLDGYKFRGHYIRMDFAEKRPRPRDYGSRRNRSYQNSSSSSSRGSLAMSSHPPVTDMVPSYGGASSYNAQFTRYEAAITSSGQAPSNHSSISTSTDMGPQSNSSGEDMENVQSSAVYGTKLPSSGYGVGTRSSVGHGGGSLFVSSRSPPPPKYTPGYGTSPGYSDASSKTTPKGVFSSSPSSKAPSNPSYVSSQSAPSYGNIAQPSGLYDNIGSTSSYTNKGSSSKASSYNGARSSPGTVPNAQAKTQSPYRNSTVQPGPGDGDDGVKSKNDWFPAAQGRSSNPSYASYGKLDPYDDPFNNYGVPDQAVVEPWSDKSSFRSGPLYGSPQPSSFNRLFVGNLALSVDDATLQHLFSSYGTVLEARVLRDPQSGRSRGFGVVAMSSVEEAKAASQALHGQRIESRPIKVDAVALTH